MADPAFIKGNYWVICDVCGFKIRASDTRMRWDRLRVCIPDWEPRHEQDLVKARAENQRVANPRPEGPDVFIEPGDVTESDL